MAQFSPSVGKMAILPVTISPAGENCRCEVFLGVNDTTKAATSGLITFTSTGAQQSVPCPITMPAIPNTYHVYIDIYVEGVLFLAYINTEDVVITAPVAQAFTFGTPVVTIVPDTGASAWKTANFSCTVKNNTSQTITRILSAWYQNLPDTTMYEEGPWAWSDFPGEGYPGRRSVTLAPGQSYTYSVLGNWLYADDGMWHAWVQVKLSGGQIGMLLKDDLGNQSPITVAVS